MSLVREMDVPDTGLARDLKAVLRDLGVVPGALVMIHCDLRRAGLTRDASGRIALKLDAGTLFGVLCDLLLLFSD